MHIAVIETGGTINGILGPEDETPTESRVLEWLKQHERELGLEVCCELVCMKDSRAVTDNDRASLAAAIERSTADHILIPHGTYTMAETGMYLREHLSEIVQQKSIILVGSLIPLGDPDSDAPAALEFAIEILRVKPAGVWIAMSQALWHPGQVVKDTQTGEFVRKEVSQE